MKKVIIVVAVLTVLGLTGCGIMMQDSMTPADYSDEMVQYAYKAKSVKDANLVPKKYAGWWKSKTELEEITTKMKIEHDSLQADLDYQKTKDLNVYVELAKKAEIYRQQAIDTQNRLFGPSGLFTLGIGALCTLVGGGIGTTLSGLTNYSESEVQSIRNNITDLMKKELWTKDEVANEVGARVLSICQTLGITDMDKIQKIMADEKAKAIAEV